MMNHVRARKLGLQQKIDANITTEWKIVGWIIELSTALLNRRLVGGERPHALLHTYGQRQLETHRGNGGESTVQNRPSTKIAQEAVVEIPMGGTRSGLAWRKG